MPSHTLRERRLRALEKARRARRKKMKASGHKRKKMK